MTKTEATTASDAYHQGIALRALAFVRARAAAGFIGGVFSYDATTPQTYVNRTVLLLQTLGWTAVDDNVADTITIS